MAEIGEYVTEIARFFPVQGKWTADDYWSLPETMHIVELVKGEIIVSPPPDTYHQDYARNLFRQLDRYVSDRNLGLVFFAPVALKTNEYTFREPDLLFLSHDRIEQRYRRYIEAPVNWVAEIISPGSRKTDEVDKLQEYAEAGIPEYWLVDPEDKSIRVYHLPDGAVAYTLTSKAGTGETAQSVTLDGFSVSVDAVFDVS